MSMCEVSSEVEFTIPILEYNNIITKIFWMILQMFQKPGRLGKAVVFAVVGHIIDPFPWELGLYNKTCS